MKCSESGAVRHGTPVLVRNGSNDAWLLRTADRLDSSWVNETRLATSEGECWKQWTPYKGGEHLDGTSLPEDGKWHRGDLCAYEDEGRIRIGFFFGNGSKTDGISQKETESVFVSDVPIAWAGMDCADFSDIELADIPAASLKRPEELWPWWKPSLYAEQADPNPHSARIVPV